MGDKENTRSTSTDTRNQNTSLSLDWPGSEYSISEKQMTFMNKQSPDQWNNFTVNESISTELGVWEKERDNIEGHVLKNKDTNKSHIGAQSKSTKIQCDRFQQK